MEAGQGGVEGSADILLDKPSSTYLYLGYCLAIVAGICFTSSNVMVKFLPRVSSWELLLVRCVLQIIAMTPLIILTKSNILGTPDFATRWRVVSQGVLGGVLLLGIFQAVSALPLGDATAIFFSSPAFTMVLSTCLLRDHCGLFRTFIAISLLGGVVILSRPPAIFPPSPAIFVNSSIQVDKAYQGEYNFVGIASAVLVPILSAWIVIITRQAKHVHYSVLVFWFAIGGLIVALVGIFFLEHEDNSHKFFQDWTVGEWMLSFCVATIGIFGSMVMTKALCWVTPSKVMVVRSFEVVVAYILQVTLFDTPTHLSDVGGTMLVILAVLSMGLEDKVMRRVSWRFM